MTETTEPRLVHDWPTVTELAKKRGTTRQAVHDLISRGRLQARTRAGRTFVDPRSVRKLDNEQGKCKDCGKIFDVVGRQVFCTPRCKTRYHSRLYFQRQKGTKSE